jgi:HPt (histidine-containing phosphotransfer) domain-containing protein
LNFNPIFVDPDLNDIIDGFVQNTIEDYKTLRNYIETKDYNQVRKLCHRILGTAISYGFNDLDTIVKLIQKAAVEEIPSDLDQHLALLTSHIEFVKEQFMLNG